MTRIERRTFLRGLGATLALPYLEISASREAPPRRLVFVYVPNGLYMDGWRLRSEGADFELSPTLEPLGDLRPEVQFLSGLTLDKARANGDGPGDHARAAAAFLTCAQPYKSAGDRIYAGVSADQIAARAIGHLTRVRSLELGCDAGRRSGQCDSGYACVYSGTLSWANATTPLTMESDPRAVFDRLFRGPGCGAPEDRSRRKSVLDLVREDARALKKELGAGDRGRVDEYLEGVGEVERRIDLAGSGAAVAEERRPDGQPADYGEHVRLLNELVVLALASDATRIVTFMHANEGSNRSYPDLDVPEGHHTLSHHGNDADKIDKIRRIDRWHVEQLAHLLRRMREVREGDGTLLDASMVVYGSGIGDGSRHNHDDLPFLLAGRGGGSLTPGVHRAYPKETPAANLYLALLDRLGVEVARLGDSTGRLELG